MDAFELTLEHPLSGRQACCISGIAHNISLSNLMRMIRVVLAADVRIHQPIRLYMGGGDCAVTGRGSASAERLLGLDRPRPARKAKAKAKAKAADGGRVRRAAKAKAPSRAQAKAKAKPQAGAQAEAQAGA